jgi:ABC-type nitrate/sulfonate/bicarbonate transport system substrate-binding protein
MKIIMRKFNFKLAFILCGTVFFAATGIAQERRGKLRISNAGFTSTALPLLAAKEWGTFTANGLDMVVILMQSALVPAALTQGDIDYQAGVGPASVNATLSGLPPEPSGFRPNPVEG